MKKVLIAEDDKFLASAYRLKLTKAGFETQIVGDGQLAIDSLQTFTPDLIILDLIMPVRDGFSTLQEIRGYEKWKVVPIIVASNLGQKEDIDKAMKLGATDFVVKSDLHLEDLITKINALIPLSNKTS